MISTTYIAFTETTSTEGMGLPLHEKNNMLIIPDVHSKMSCFIMSVRSSSLTSFRYVCWMCDGTEVKQPLHSRFMFEKINHGIRAIMTSPTLLNESVKLFLSLSATSFSTLVGY